VGEKGRKVKKNATQPSGRVLDLILITLIVFSVLGLGAIMIAAYGGFLD
jgi:flagellar basal body-associated protein FliL